MRVVIVGGGITGTTCAEELRRLRPDAEIVLVSEEEHPVYSRVLLTPYLVGKVPRERIFLKKPEWYAQQRMEWLTGVRADAVDTKNAHVVLSDGRELPYDKLLIASGGEVRPIEEDLRGVSYLRTLDDAEHLNQLLNERVGTECAAIWGGGFIACEYLNIYAHRAIPTAIAFRGPYFWSRVLDAEGGELVNDHLRSRGVEVIPNATLEHLVGAESLEGISLRSASGQQTVACSILGIGVGVESDLSWLSSSEIETGTGIRTNEYLETNVPNVYAAGDIAEFMDVAVGRQRQVGTWQNAMTQGRVVAKTMAGDQTAFNLVTSYAANALGLDLIFVGDTVRAHADAIRVVGSREQGGVTQLFERGGVLVGATIIGRNRDRMPITRAIQERTPPILS